MIDEKPGSLSEGILTSRYGEEDIQLEGVFLQPNDQIEICVLNSWLPGYVQYDTGGWYLLTPDGVGIRLRSGLLARRCSISLDLLANGA